MSLRARKSRVWKNGKISMVDRLFDHRLGRPLRLGYGETPSVQSPGTQESTRKLSVNAKNGSTAYAHG